MKNQVFNIPALLIIVFAIGIIHSCTTDDSLNQWLNDPEVTKNLTYEDVDIGNVKVYSLKEFMVTIKNSGKDTIEITKIEFGKLDELSYRPETYDGGNDLSSLMPGSERILTFFIKPENLGLIGIKVLVYSPSNKDGKAVEIKVTGKGIPRTLAVNPAWPTWSDCASGSMNISKPEVMGRTYRTVSAGNYKVRVQATIDSTGIAYFEIKDCQGNDISSSQVVTILEMHNFDIIYAQTISEIHQGVQVIKAKFPLDGKAFEIVCDIGDEYTRPINVEWY